MRYGVALFPSKSFQEKINSYRKRYDTHYAWIPPHVTLKEAFELKDDEVEAAVRNIRELSSDLRPIRLVVTKVGSFYPVNNVIYLRVEDDPTLLELHERLNSARFIQAKPKYRFVPHITIAQDLSDIEHADVLDRLKMLEFRHEEIVDRFHLLYQTENRTWKIRETFYLGGE
jgi:2'-5' RNA ligase